MVKHSFELKQYSNCFKLSIIGHEKPGTLDWRQVTNLTPDELDDLRRLLGVGMGDCDHCDAWKDWKKPIPDKVRCEMRDAAIISHDMTRFREQLDKLEEQIVSVQSKTNKTESHLNTMAASYGKRIESLELSRLAHANRLGGMDKTIEGFEQGSKYANDKFDCIDALITKVENRINDVARNTTNHLKRLEADVFKWSQQNHCYCDAPLKDRVLKLEEGQKGLDSTCQLRWGQIQDLRKEVKHEFDLIDRYLKGTQPCEFAKGVSEEQDIHSQHLTKLDALVSTMQSDLEILKLALVTINESNRKDAPDKPGSRGSKKN